ncbi:MAG: protein kinase [Nitrolancea sp.]
MSGSDLIGQTLGSYRIDAVLGTGGMGQVYRATHVMLNRAAAIKVMNPAVASDANFQARFIQEAQAASALSHPNIIQIYEFGEQDGRYYLVMELVTGGSLRSLLILRSRDPEALSLAEGLDLICQTTDALEFAHESGWVHRDIKPDNLLLQRRNHGDHPRGYVVKVNDFGIARLATGGVKTQTGVAIGTPTYMSPEQCQGIELDGRSDIYSLGVVLYELATGLVPFKVTSLNEAIYKHIYTAPLPPRQAKPEIPVKLDQIILRCLAKNPDNRYQHAADLRAALEDFMTSGTAAGGVGTATDGPVTLLGTSEQHADERTVVAPVNPSESSPAMTTMLGATSQPLVRVTDAHGETLRELPLTANGLTVGRLPDNDLVLEGNDVSRHHVRLEWDGARVTATDLGSSNGTLLADVRLLPHVPQTWSSRDWLRVGHFWLRYQAPTDRDFSHVRRNTGDTQLPSQQSKRIHITLDQDRLTLTPGQPTVVRAVLTNLGSIVDHLAVMVEGVPSEWVTGPQQETQLNPGAQASVALDVLVPRTARSIARDYPVTVRARSRDTPAESAVTDAQWTVLPFTGGNLTIEPIRRGGRSGAIFELSLKNDGNAPELFTLSGQDDEQVLRYGFGQATVRLEAGDATNVQLRIGSKRHWIGSAQNRPFRVQAKPDSGAPPYNVAGVYVHKAFFPTWFPLLALAVLAALAFVIWKLLSPGSVSSTLTPSIDVWSVTPDQGQPGLKVTIKWQVSNVEDVEIDKIGPVAASGDETVTLQNTTTFKLTATNKGKTATRVSTVTIASPTAGPTSPPQPTATIGVPGTPALQTSAETARKGEQLTVSGTGFGPGETVTIFVHASPVKQVNADDNGSFSTVITIPESAPPPGFPTVIEAAGQSGRSAQVPFETAP